MNIFELQAGLRSLGQNPGPLDGKWGKQTHDAARKLQQVYSPRRDIPDERLGVYVEQVIYSVIGGLATGPFDGHPGPITDAAARHWERGPWRNVLLREDSADERMPATTLRWPKYEDLAKFYGDPGTGLVTVSLPFPLRLSWQPRETISSIRCHEKVAQSLVLAYQEIGRAYRPSERNRLRIDVTGGCYAARPMRGSTKLSTHAYGIAIDTDPVNNGLRMGRDKAWLARSEYEAFWAAWTAEGWTSLGKARNFDWMHVQACRL